MASLKSFNPQNSFNSSNILEQGFLLGDSYTIGLWFNHLILDDEKSKNPANHPLTHERLKNYRYLGNASLFNDALLWSFVGQVNEDRQVLVYSPHYNKSLFTDNSNKKIPIELTSSLKVTNNLDIFFATIKNVIKKLRKVSKNKPTTITIDENIPLLVSKFLESFTIDINKQLSTSTFSLSHKQMEAYRDIHNHLEMAFIYGCSFIKIGTQLEELEKEMYDYLQAKTYYGGKVYVKAYLKNSSNATAYPQDAVTINDECYIVLHLTLNWLGLEGSFYRTVAISSSGHVGRASYSSYLKNTPLNNSIKKNLLSMSDLKASYQSVEKILKRIIKKILSLPHTLDEPASLKWKDIRSLWSEVNKNSNNRITKDSKNKPVIKASVRFLSEGFRPKNITRDCVTDFLVRDIFFLSLKDTKSGIIIGTTIFIHEKHLEVLEKYGFHYLEFPW